MKGSWGLHYFLLAVILVAGSFYRLHNLGHPEGYYFDEVYHVPTAQLIAKNDPRAYEWIHGELTDQLQAGTYIDWLHPPLAKLLQALSIRNVGDTPLAWRLPSALAGIMSLFLVYVLARLVCRQPQAALLAPLWGAVDGLAIAQSRITMNDMITTMFMLAGVLFYYLYQVAPKPNRWLWPLALTVGLACASKWSGVFLLGLIGVWQISSLVAGQWRQWRQTLAFLFFLGCTTILIYLLSYFQLFQSHDWNHFVGLHNQIWWYQVNLDAQHPFSSRAFEWPLGLKPVFLYLNSETGEEIWNRPFYPTWYLALLALGVGLMLLIVGVFKQKTPGTVSENNTFPQLRALFYLISAYFFFWAPWLASPRIMFFYHYLPAVPLLWVITAVVVDILGSLFFGSRSAIIKEKEERLYER